MGAMRLFNQQKILGGWLILLLVGLTQGALGDDLSVSDASPVIAGVVLGADGVPLEGVQVIARSAAMGGNLYQLAISETWTDEMGNFRAQVDFPDILYKVSFQYPGEGTKFKEVLPSDESKLVIQFNHPGTHCINGVVVNGEEGDPVEGATVMYFGERQKFKLETSSDTEGRFEFTALPQAEYQGVLYAQMDDHVSTARRVQYTKQKEETYFKLVLDKGTQFEGVATKSSSGEALENCRITLTTFYESGFELNTVTQEDGTYVFKHVPAGMIRIIATHDDYFEKNKMETFIPAEHGEQYVYNPELMRMATLEGHVLNLDGEFVPGAIVAINEARTNLNEYSPYVVRTDKEGEFSIKTGLPLTEGEGNVVEAFSPKGGHGTAKFSHLQEGEVRKDVTIRLTGTMRVRGQVTNSNGVPQEGIFVNYSNIEFFEMYTDSEGRFDFHILPFSHPEIPQARIVFLAPRPEGTLLMQPKARMISDAIAYESELGFLHHKIIDFKKEPNKEYNFDVELESTSLITLYGTIRDGDGEAVPDARLGLYPDNISQSYWANIQKPDLAGSIGNRTGADIPIFNATADKRGNWEIVIARESKKGMNAAFWCNDKDPLHFSIVVQANGYKPQLQKDVVVGENESQKEVSIQLERVSQ